MIRHPMTPGLRFGKLVVKGKYEACTGGERLVLCQCDCGNECKTRARYLYGGYKKSCGCIYRTGDKRKRGKLSERMGLYRIWYEMKRRCSPGITKTKRTSYYERGIRVCERWSADGGFQNFVDDMAPRPSPKHSIDRRDTLGPYSPENCRWATAVEQAHNSRKNHMLTLDGETLCLQDWARRYGIPSGALLQRVQRGMSLRDALKKPVAKRRPMTESKRIRRLAAKLGITHKSIQRRLRRGWTFRDATSIPPRSVRRKRKTLG